MFGLAARVSACLSVDVTCGALVFILEFADCVVGYSDCCASWPKPRGEIDSLCEETATVKSEAASAEDVMAQIDEMPCRAKVSGDPTLPRRTSNRSSRLASW